ncbi:MAG: hypothetical protein VKJ46_16420 [Leptolyngbyaceae bacterium]|nr:hypothetical protein [Leptolyngbyaceae bacterium]
MPHQEPAQLLLETLNAYVSYFGIPNSSEQLQAIAGSILTLQQKQGNLAISSDQIESLIQQVVGQFDIAKIASPLSNPDIAAQAQQVHQWQESLESETLNILNAYVQQYLPNQTTLNLRETILSILPMVEDIHAGRACVESLIQQVTSRFSWEAALAQGIGAESGAIAHKLAGVLNQGTLETLLQETVTAYLQGSELTLQNVTASIVQKAMSAIVASGSQFGLDIDLGVEDQGLLIQQVSFKLNLLQAAPPTSKTAQQIATQMQQEIERFHAERHKVLGAANLMQPTILGDLSVGIPIQKVNPIPGG